MISPTCAEQFGRMKAQKERIDTCKIHLSLNCCIVRKHKLAYVVFNFATKHCKIEDCALVYVTLWFEG